MRLQLPRRTPEPPVDDSVDRLREERLDDVRALAERFIYDLGLLIAGHEPRFDEYVNPAVGARLRRGMEPFLATGDAMRPNFGEYAELRVEGNLVDGREPIHVEVEFDDLSVRETQDGEAMPTPRRRMLLTLSVDPSCRRVLEARLQPVGG